MSEPAPTVRRFPDGFTWGAATASYQVEGAVDEDGRGASIWDVFSHTPGRVARNETGDVACDHYHRYREDVGLLASLGLNAYRFSVAWPRVLPAGRGRVNQAGLDFYDRLVDELLAHGIAPFVTLYHWDLPQALEDAGGWPVRDTPLAFSDYAAVVARRLGDRVRHVATLNEPRNAADDGYRRGVHAPGRTDNAVALAAAHHLLLGHALAVRAIRAEAPGTAAGVVLNFDALHPATGHLLDVEAAAIAHEQVNRWFLDPLTGRGYPEDGARAWGWSRREIAPGDMDLIRSPIDFLGVNYYSHRYVRSPLLPPLARDPAAGDERTGLGWPVYPQGLTEVLDFVASRTGDLPLFVTENGAGYEDDSTADAGRVRYLRAHLGAALDAIEHGVPLHGYFAWSLLDNFEWALGYAARFGIVGVDYATQRRTVRDSGRFLASVARANALPADDAGARTAR